MSTGASRLPPTINLLFFSFAPSCFCLPARLQPCPHCFGSRLKSRLAVPEPQCRLCIFITWVSLVFICLLHSDSRAVYLRFSLSTIQWALHWETTGYVLVYHLEFPLDR